MTLSAVALADEWIPIRPGTDTAMMSAMAHVMIEERPLRRGIRPDALRRLRRDPDARRGGRAPRATRITSSGARDGVPKTPEWAEAITGVPRETIARIAREYATTKPGVLYQGYGMQRRAYGEQVVRAGCVLAAITGNVGVAGRLGQRDRPPGPRRRPAWSGVSDGPEPGQGRDPELPLDRGRPAGQGDGARRRRPRRRQAATRTSSASGPSPPTPSSTSTATSTARRRSSRTRTSSSSSLVQDNFLTPTGRFADILLPACTQFETWGVEDGWKYGDEVLLMPRIVEPPGETKSDYRIAAEIAARLGLGEAYTEGRERARLGSLDARPVPEGPFPGPAGARRVREVQMRASTRSRSRSRPSPSPISGGTR